MTPSGAFRHDAGVKRIHIVGCPRSGTTLTLESMVQSFDIDGWSSKELVYAKALAVPDSAHRVYCSKQPRDFLVMVRLLPLEPDLHVVFLLRDPRDVVASRHKLDPGRYWTNLRIWKRALAAARRVFDHPRFVLLRYEDLVRDPEGTQAELARRLPFLTPTGPMREFSARADPSNQSLEALHELRPIDDRSIGRWRRHKPRVAGQIRQHGPVSDELIEFGYEEDAAWLEELEGVTPDLSPSHNPEHLTLRLRWRHALRARKAWRKYERARARRG